MGSSKALGHDIPSSILSYRQIGLKEASLDTKPTTFLLLSCIKLEEWAEQKFDHTHTTKIFGITYKNPFG